MAKARLPGNGAPSTTPKKPPKPVRLVHRWEVRLYLGDQCEWYICGVVEALTENNAIMRGRHAVSNAWPSFCDVLDPQCLPAQASRL